MSKLSLITLIINQGNVDYKTHVLILRKIAVCFLWLSLPGHYRVTDEALLAETA